MGAQKVVPMDKPSGTKRPSRPVTEKKQAPATSPEQQEARLVNAAMDLAEKQINDGTASAAVITHFLKLGTEREKLERAKIQNEVHLAAAKTQSIKEAKDGEQLAKQAVEAMKSYGPSQ